MTSLPLIYISEKAIGHDREGPERLTSLRAAGFYRASKYYETKKRVEYDL